MKQKLIAIFFLLSMLCFSHGAYATQQTIIGTLDEFREVGMSFMRLIPIDEGEEIFLGASYEIENECIIQALNDETPIKLSGKFGSLEGEIFLDLEEEYSCSHSTTTEL